MNKEEKAKVKEALEGFYRSVLLKIDGYWVCCRLVRLTTFKNAIEVLVWPEEEGEYDGKFKHLLNFLLQDCEERRRFARPITEFIYGSKTRAEMKKLRIPKKHQTVDFNKKGTRFEAFWHNINAMISHFEKNNEFIQVIEVRG